MRTPQKILVPFLFSVVVITVFCFVIYFFATQAITHNISENLVALAENRTSHINYYLLDNIDKVKLIASRTQLRQTVKDYQSNPSANKIETLNSIILDAKKEIEDFEIIFVLDSSGKVIYSTSQKIIGTDFSAEKVFSESQEYVFYDIADKFLKFSVPMVLEDEFIGKIVVYKSMNDLDFIFSNRKGMSATSELVIGMKLSDTEAYIFSPLRFEAIASANRTISFDSSETPIIIALQGQDGLIPEKAIDYRGQEVLSAVKYLPIANWGLVAKIDIAEVSSYFNHLKIVIGISFFGLILMVYLVLTFFSRRIFKVLNKLQADIQESQETDFQSAINIDKRNEVKELARAFEKMRIMVVESKAYVDNKIELQTQELKNTKTKLESQQKAILNVLEDVEEEKDKVEGERDKTAAILYSIGDGVFVLNREYKIVLFNKAAEKITAFTAKKTLDKNFEDILKFEFEDVEDKDKNKEFIHKAMKTGKVVELEKGIQLLKGDNTKIFVAISVAPLKDSSGTVTGAVVVFRDVTREREIDMAKSEFVSVSSHQLRTPLSAMKWSLESLISNDDKTLTGEQLDLLEQLDQSNERMISLVNDLLDVSRIEKGKIILQPKPVDLVDLVSQIIKAQSPIAEAKNVKINFKFPSKMSLCFVDPDKITQAISNIISNAVKYSLGKTTVTILAEEKKKNLLLSITDQGVGVPKHQQKRLFERFFRADNVQKLQTEGTGLGLYIAKTIIENSGGSISFKSVENKGTTFWIELPIK